MSRLKQATTEFNELQAKFKTQISEIMKEEFSKFFDEYPEVTALIWTQYTPYFNDGEPCYFGRGDIMVRLKAEFYGEEITEDDLDDWDMHDFDSHPLEKPSEYVYAYRHKYPSYNEDILRYEKKVKIFGPRAKVVSDGIRSFVDDIAGVGDAIFEAMFGDHVKVTATRDGFDIDEYDHY